MRAIATSGFACALFGESGISIYGYYKPATRTIVVNASTGEGTLLHELTHALVDFDLPGAAEWFNEGLASLHEQSCFREGADGPWIEGLVNWRLVGLQKMVRQGRLRSLESLVAGSDFRGPLEGTNYAHARYFCLYMQDRGVLRQFVRAYRVERAARSARTTSGRDGVSRDELAGAGSRFPAVGCGVAAATIERLDVRGRRAALG